MEAHEEKLDFTRRPSKQAVAGGLPDCLLTIGSQRLAAILGDEWDNGMSVTIQGTPAFWVEDTGVLQTAEVEIEVRVSNIVRLDTEGDEDEPAAPLASFRIGLVRLSQIAVKLRSDAMPSTEQIQAQALSYLGREPSRLTRGAVLAFALVAAPLIFLAAAVAWHYYGPKTSAPQTDGTAGGDAAISTPKADQPSPSPVVQQIAPEIVRLPGVEPFLKPEVARRLELTPSQTGAFARLNDTTLDALEELEKYFGNGSRLELQAKKDVVLRAALQEGLRLLTGGQRQQWEAMAR